MNTISAIDFATEKFGSQIVKKADLIEAIEAATGYYPPAWMFDDSQRVEHGLYDTEYSNANSYEYEDLVLETDNDDSQGGSTDTIEPGVYSAEDFLNKALGNTQAPRKDILNVFKKFTGKKPPVWVLNNAQKVERGIYSVVYNPENPRKYKDVVVTIGGSTATNSTNNNQPNSKVDDTVAITAPKKTATEKIGLSEGALIPDKFPGFVATPQYRQIRAVIKSRQFFPVYVTGDTGGGKTISIRHACALEKRELVRVNMSSMTSDVHLIGSYKIVDGETVWQDGPVVIAMKRGACLLLDEVDLSTDRVLCLQSVLEGSSLLIERTGEVVSPKAGFTIFATANTKGRMDANSARFAGARTQNEAFLDRFSMTIEYPYATEALELKILDGELTRVLKSVGLEREEKDDNFFKTFFAWVRSVRDTYTQGVADFHISTRRACAILQSYAIFNRNIKIAISNGVARFDETTSESFLRLFNSLNRDKDIDWGDTFDSDNDEGE